MNSAEVMNSAGKADNEDVKLKFGEKLAVVLNGTTGIFHNIVIQMFLLFFYTDVMKINAAFVVPLFLTVSIVSAVLAPVFGVFVDKVTTPWGKYKPWHIGFSVLVSIFGWLSFTDFGLSPNGRLLYATITYFLYSSFRSSGQALGGALGPAVTKRLDDRISMNQISYFLMMITAMLASAAVQPLYKKLGGGNDAKGFSLIMGAVFVVTLFIAVYQWLTIKERYVVYHKKGEKKPSVKEMFAAIFTNKTALITYAYTFGLSLSGGIRSSVTIYYLKYYFHNEGLMAVNGLIGMLPTLLGVLFSSKVTKFLGIKTNLVLGTIVSMVTTAAILAVPPTKAGIIIFLVLSVVGGLFSGLSTPAQGTMMPAAMDYTEWKTGKNINAFMASFGGFVQTLATALSGSIVAGSLVLIGYVASEAQQNSSTIFGIRVLMSVLPAAATLITLAVVKFDLTKEKQAQITRELAERRQNAVKAHAN